MDALAAKLLPVEIQYLWQLHLRDGNDDMVIESTGSISDVGLDWSADYGNAILKANLANRLETTPATSEKTEQDNLLVQVGWVF